MMRKETVRRGSATLRPRARIIRTIGRDLISNEVVSLVELIKNAYDADATNVRIVFEEPLQPSQGGIVIEDDGVGMSLAVIKKAWFEPATISKTKNTHTPSGRRVTGEKGVGRFAATLAPLIDAPDARVELTAVCDGSPPSNEGTTESILDEAKNLTNGSRQADYGHPRDDFARTAAMWNGILAAKLRDGATITAMDVPLCLIAVKIAREVHSHKRDNLVDIAGYTRTAAMVAGEE
jgi:hypothetical protein